MSRINTQQGKHSGMATTRAKTFSYIRELDLACPTVAPPLPTDWDSHDKDEVEVFVHFDNGP
jgi:hypothetical protein